MTDSPRSPALAAIEPLDDAGCRELLARHRLCTLSMVDGLDPYAVPLYYGFDGETLYLGLAEGRKTAVLDTNGKICINVVEAGGGDRWASVQVTGEAEWLTGEARERAVQVLISHNRSVVASARPGSSAVAPRQLRVPDAVPSRRHAGGRILRVSNPRMSGRTRP